MSRPTRIIIFSLVLVGTILISAGSRDLRIELQQNLGSVYLFRSTQNVGIRQEEMNTAKSLLTETAKEKPWSLEKNHYELAVVYALLGDTEQETAELGTLIKNRGFFSDLDLELFDAYVRYADILRERGQSSRSLAYLETALGLNPHSYDSSASRYKARIFVKAGDSAYREFGDLGRMAAHYESAVDLDPGNYWPYHILIEMYLSRGREDQALQVQQMLARVAPFDSRTFMYLGMIYYYQHNYPKAILSLRRALELKPEDEFSFLWLGKSYLDSGDFRMATCAFRQSARISPTNAMYFDYLSRGLGGLGDQEGRISALVISQSLDPEGYNWVTSLPGFAHAGLKESGEILTKRILDLACE